MGKQIQFTKKDAYHTPGKAKRERIKVTTIQKAHLLKKFSNVLRITRMVSVSGSIQKDS